jgi:hypothetical protein
VPDRRLRIATWCAALCALAGCLTPERAPQSEWPPPDFRFEVQHALLERGRMLERRRVRFDVDGVVFFREATGALEDPASAHAWPLFGRTSRYRMARESTRQLSRLLARAGLLDLAAPQSEETGAPDALTYRWQAFGSGPRHVVLHGKLYGPAMRVLRVTNAFLPERHEIVLAQMTGETEERHLLAVPPPTDSLQDALGHHEAMLQRAPDDAELLAETIVLAHAIGDTARALELIDRLALLEEAQARVRQVFPEGSEDGAAVRLRALVEARAPVRDARGGG